MQLTIGSIRAQGTDGIIVIRGRRQIALEWGPFNAELQLTMDLYGPDARHIARLRRNQWTFNDHDRFDFASRDGSFRLTDTKANEVILAGNVAGRDAVAITSGTFCSADGERIEITPEGGIGLSEVQPWTKPVARATIPPFAEGEVTRLREEAATTGEPLLCPRCGEPLVTEQATRAHGVLVSCPDCRGNLVIEPQG